MKDLYQKTTIKMDYYFIALVIYKPSQK